MWAAHTWSRIAWSVSTSATACRAAVPRAWPYVPRPKRRALVSSVAAVTSEDIPRTPDVCSTRSCSSPASAPSNSARLPLIATCAAEGACRVQEGGLTSR